MTLSTPEQRQARMKLAARFLEALLKEIAANAPMHPYDVIQRYDAFRAENAGLGDDFDIAHTFALAWRRDKHNDYLADHAPEDFPEDAVDVAVAVAVLEMSIDFIVDEGDEP